ncbi:hypothetical protein C0Q70_19479 [Pomacea canaliculata]|uniref:Uncharacterized protein n=1 Tax=Pomacea canaliculata TaxID=400727 RepID=A0A2T7NJH8_POMCA|nr:hypothetical protein C0Q70_19479 [Pomacea canaliculata]
MIEEELLPGERTPVTTEKTFSVDMTIAEMIQQESVDRESTGQCEDKALKITDSCHFVLSIKPNPDPMTDKKSEKSKERDDELWGLPELQPPQTREEITGMARFLVNMKYAGLLLSIFPLFLLVAVAADLYMESLKLLTILSVQNSALMLMGVEVGDTIHNCIMAFLLNGDNFRRGFGIVAAYDIFNLLKLLCFFPLETATGVIFRLSQLLTSTMREYHDEREQLIQHLPCEMIGNEELYPETYLLLTITRTFTRFVAMVRRPVIKQDSLRDNTTLTLLSSRWLTVLVATGLGVVIDVAGLAFIVVIILMALGFFRLRRAFPIMLGLGLGRMVKIEFMALRSSTVRDCRKSTEVVIMLLIYKIFGIFLWYALPFLRQAPLHAAKKIGRSVNMYTIISVIYFLGVFVLIPLLVYGISFLAWQVELVFCIVCLALIDFVIIVNVLQAKIRSRLPSCLQTWASFGIPRWMRSYHLFESQRNKKFFSVLADGSYRMSWMSFTSLASSTLRRVRSTMSRRTSQDPSGEKQDVKQ